MPPSQPPFRPRKIFQSLHHTLLTQILLPHTFLAYILLHQLRKGLTGRTGRILLFGNTGTNRARLCMAREVEEGGCRVGARIGVGVAVAHGV